MFTLISILGLLFTGVGTAFETGGTTLCSAGSDAVQKGLAAAEAAAQDVAENMGSD